MAAVDIAGFVAELKDHSVDHGFHVHDERHFVETYSLGQAFEVDLHPEAACGGPLDLHLALEVDPRVVLAFEDAIAELEVEPDPETFPTLDRPYVLSLHFNWGLPPLPTSPDLLVLATELAGIGGTELPLEVSATDSYPAVTDGPERRLSIVGRVEVSLVEVYLGREQLCDILDRSRDLSAFLLDRIGDWTTD